MMDTFSRDYAMSTLMTGEGPARVTDSIRSHTPASSTSIHFPTRSANSTDPCCASCVFRRRRTPADVIAPIACCLPVAAFSVPTLRHWSQSSGRKACSASISTSQLSAYGSHKLPHRWYRVGEFSSDHLLRLLLVIALIVSVGGGIFYCWDRLQKN
jgi:hypothetical protein